MVVDDPLPNGECWFRLITETKHITGDQTVHGSALRFHEADARKGWKSELSGCIASLHSGPDEITARGEALVSQRLQWFLDNNRKVQKGIRYCGVVCAKSEDLRGMVNGLETDVVYTPRLENQTHSDFIIRNTKEYNGAIDWLTKTLKVIKPEAVNSLFSSCGSVLNVSVANIPSTAGKETGCLSAAEADIK